MVSPTDFTQFYKMTISRTKVAHLKPAFHGACFGAVSAPILSARVPLRASAAFEKERFHYEHSSCFHGRRLPR